MAPEPPRLNECLRVADFETVDNEADIPPLIDEVRGEIYEFSLSQGYTLITNNEENDTPPDDYTNFHNGGAASFHNTSLFDDSDSDSENESNDEINSVAESILFGRSDTAFAGEIESGLTDTASDNEVENVETKGDADNVEESEQSSCSSNHNGGDGNVGNTVKVLEIDNDEVKAAMIGFTLPPSSIPPWAANLSDEDITNHINRLILNKK